MVSIKYLCQIILWEMVQSLYQCLQHKCYLLFNNMYNVMCESQPKGWNTHFSVSKVLTIVPLYCDWCTMHIFYRFSFMLDAQLFANFQYHTWERVLWAMFYALIIKSKLFHQFRKMFEKVRSFLKRLLLRPFFMNVDYSVIIFVSRSV